MNIPSSNSYGWKLKDDSLEIDWMSGQSVPWNLIHQHCKCKKTACATAMCSCLKLKIPCTELYAWISCKNCETDPDDESDINPESNAEDCLPTTFKTTTKKIPDF